MNMIYKVFILITALFLNACMNKTTVMIKTKPSAANVVIINDHGEQKGKVLSDTIFKIKNNEDFFADDRDVTSMILLSTKPGYKPEITYLNRIQKNEDNDDKEIVLLEKLNTNISVETNPPGANIWFLDAQGKHIPFLVKEAVNIRHKSIESLIKDHLRDIDQTDKESVVDKVITPFEQNYTEDLVKSRFNKISKIYIEKQDYNPVLQNIAIIPGESNVFSFHLKPFSTSLKIISFPADVEIEDMADNGFGYLGKAPLIRKFSFDEVAKRYILRKDSSIKMILKATKPGYEDEYMNVDVPIGEQKTIKVSLHEQPKEISFQSDPQGAHVYVYRTQKRDVYDKKTKKIISKALPYWKHLGATPFTYYMDSSDPLKHGDSLIFRRSGFSDAPETFKSGVNNYHQVLEPPKGSVNYEGVISK